jgi:DNA-binding MarR family transcriptional regulator
MENSNNPEHAAFGLLVRDVSRLMRKRFELKLGIAGFTQAQWSVVFALAQSEGANQSALAKLLDIEPITLVGLLDKLEAAGLVERRPSPSDRRARLLYLTQKAQPLLKKTETVRAELRREAFGDIPEPQQEQIITMLQVVKNNLLRSTRDNIH